MIIKNITNTKAIFSHQPICDNNRLKPVACELLFRGYKGKELKDYLDEPALFVSHLDELVEAKASSITSLYDSHDYAIYFVNFTPCQIASPSFISALRWFDKNNIPASSVVIEVTELPLCYKQDEAFLNNIALSRAKGHLIALDDFGADSSSFNRVLSLQPDIVKLDADLLQLTESLPHIKHSLRALVTFIHEVGAKCIIEGVETKSLLDFARTCGADYLQGYFLSRPSLVVTPSTRDLSRATQEVDPLAIMDYVPSYSF